MEIYLVGGAVRDALLGIPVADKDYLVEGCDAEQMMEKGFERVGKEKGVFLHPDTGEEYTLLQGIADDLCQCEFLPLSSGAEIEEIMKRPLLEQDLWQRDFTVNAMAQKSSGHIIDPYGGQQDLRAKVLRCVSPVSFALSPIRVLRGARLAAKLGFEIEEETLELMKNMVSKGCLDNLPSERLWKEISRGLSGENSESFCVWMDKAGVWDKLIPATEYDVKTLVRYLGRVKGFDLESLYATLMLNMYIPVNVHNRYAERLGVPHKIRDFANALMTVYPFNQPSRRNCWMVLKHTDAIRKPERFEKLLTLCDALYNYSPTKHLWLDILNTVKGADLLPVLAHTERGGEAQAVESFRKGLAQAKCQELGLE